MTEFTSQCVNVNCNAQWTKCHKKITDENCKISYLSHLNLFVLNKWRCHFLCATSTAGTVLMHTQVPLAVMKATQLLLGLLMFLRSAATVRQRQKKERIPALVQCIVIGRKKWFCKF